MNLETLTSEARTFLIRTFTELKGRNVYLEGHWHIDHLCYRASSQEKYSSLKKSFETFSTLLIESEVNGRMISTFKLPVPITYGDWDIDLIELPAPKKGKVVSDGFEHFEVVCDIPFKEIKARYLNCEFDESGLAKNFNQELELELSGCAVKFHHLSLQSVINVELKNEVFSALKESNILNVLKPFDPLIAGTFPLNLNFKNSDIDVLITVTDFDLVKKTINEHFSSQENFKLKEVTLKNERTLLATFSFKGIPFEIFGQETPSVRQTGYLHFLAEERILKLGSEILFERVKFFREQGMKTELSFACALNISADPYEALLSLQQKSNVELKEVVKLHC